MVREAEQARADLDAADKKTLGRAKTAGEAMRAAWASGSSGTVAAPTVAPMSTLKSAPDDDAMRKLKAKTEAAQAYYKGLVADNSLALDRINAEEEKALAENLRRQAEDKNNAEIYAKARVEITRKYARERGALEEKETQQIAELNIATMAARDCCRVMKYCQHGEYL